MATITTTITSPSGVAITAGTLTFSAVNNLNGVIKNSIMTAVPGNNVSLVNNTYNVYYLPDYEDVKYFVGNISVTGDAALADLLEASDISMSLDTNITSSALTSSVVTVTPQVGDPTHSASKGTLYVDTANANLWINTSGSTTWVKVGNQT